MTFEGNRIFALVFPAYLAFKLAHNISSSQQIREGMLHFSQKSVRRCAPVWSLVRPPFLFLPFFSFFTLSRRMGWEFLPSCPVENSKLARIVFGKALSVYNFSFFSKFALRLPYVLHHYRPLSSTTALHQ